MEISVADLYGVGFGAILTSAIVEGLKRWLGTDPWVNKIIVIVVALVLATIYVLWRSSSWFTIAIGILGASQVIYGLILKSNQPASA